MPLFTHNVGTKRSVAVCSGDYPLAQQVIKLRNYSMPAFAISDITGRSAVKRIIIIIDNNKSHKFCLQYFQFAVNHRRSLLQRDLWMHCRNNLQQTYNVHRDSNIDNNHGFVL